MEILYQKFGYEFIYKSDRYYRKQVRNPETFL